MKKPTGKLAFAYETIRGLESRVVALGHQNAALAAEVERLSAVQEPVAHMANNSSGFPEKCLPTDPDGFPVYRKPAPPSASVSALVEALEQGFPLLSDEGLDEVEHHCEWVIQRERKRVHSILAAHRKQGGEA